MSRINFLEVKSEESITRVAALASQIWREHYTPIIGEAQVDYMLSNFQSPEAIQRKITVEGYHYYILEDDQGVARGYLGFVLKEQELFLSKIYLTLESRGFGYAREAMSFLENYARERNCSKVSLTVNKENRGAISAYEKLGFRKVESIIQDIGGGFVMDDYRMEKFIGPPVS